MVPPPLMGEGDRWRGRSRELAQKAQVVGLEEPHVVHAVAQHGDALDAQAEGEAAINRRVVADAAQHTRVHHPGAAHLQPARILADAAARALAGHAINVELGAWLCEWEVAGAEADLAVGAEHLAGEPLDDTTQIRHRAELI